MATTWEWLGDPVNSIAIKTVCTLIGVSTSIWSCYKLIKKLRGRGLDDTVDAVSGKTDRLIFESQTQQALLEKIYLKLHPATSAKEVIPRRTVQASVPMSPAPRPLAEDVKLRSRHAPPSATIYQPISIPKVTGPIQVHAVPEKRTRRPTAPDDQLSELARLIGNTDPSAKLSSDGKKDL
jgi:hypothetical protein